MKVSHDVISILSDCRIEDNVLYLPPVQLDRSLYVDVNKVLEAMGGKWSRKMKAHIFTTVDTADLLDEVLITGEIVSEVKRFQFFPTPRGLAERLVELADIPESGTVLEPSSGEGAIADVIRIRRPNACLTCVEINDRFAAKLTANGHVVFCQDFLGFENSDGYDRIIANPPFTHQQDIDHVWHMLSLLKPGGRLVSVMSASVLFRNNKKTVDFRQHIDRLCGSFIELPSGSFAESGTMVESCIVVV